MRRESPIVPEDKAERPLLIWEREGARRVSQCERRHTCRNW